MNVRDLIDPEEQEALDRDLAAAYIDNPTAAQVERAYRAMRRILAVGGQPFTEAQEAQAEARIAHHRREEERAS